MQSHEIEVKNKNGKTLTVSVEHYESNVGELTPTMDKKEVDAYCKKHHATKSAAVKAMQEEDKEKMEKEALKNKSR